MSDVSSGDGLPTAPPLRTRALAEMFGTFVIVFAPVALSGSGAFPGADTTLAASAWASGLAVLCMIYTLGHICRAHFNPAVTIGLCVGRAFPWRDAPAYICAQLVGGVLAAVWAKVLFGPGAWGVHHVAANLPLWRACLLEATLTFVLMRVIFGSAVDRRARPEFAGLAIGLVVVVLVWIGGPLTGGSMNPARSLGPQAILDPSTLKNAWVYIVGPIAGAITAAMGRSWR